MKNLILFFLTLLVITSELKAQTTRASDGSRADVQAKIDLSSDTDIVTIPSGSFTWTSTVTISGKGIKLQGAGASKVLGRSLSTVAFGASGTKTFTTTVSGLAIIAGDPLRIYRTNGEYGGGGGFGTGNGIWMDCTVTSYSGTSLVVSVTSASPTGTGSYEVWSISTRPSTRTEIISNTASLIEITEDVSNSVEISGLDFVAGTSNGYLLTLNPTTNALPVLIHDSFFSINSNTSVLDIKTNKGVIWNCTFISPSISPAPLAIHHKAPGLTVSWATASTMGAADTTGKSNVYVEDCWFVGWLISSDSDDNARTVFRRNYYDHAGVGTHGADTSTYGVRHFEVYDCTFYHVNLGASSPNITQWFYLRGGTFAISDNVIPALDTSGNWGSPATFKMTIQNLQRDAGPFGLWGDNISGNQVPAPRQVGYGNPTGASSVLDPGSYAVHGVLEPVYMWNNTGTGSSTVSLSDYATPTGNQDSVTGYIRAGTEYYNDGTAKPGYTKYTYPHPLRTGATPSAFTSSLLGKIKLSGKATIK